MAATVSLDLPQKFPVHVSSVTGAVLLALPQRTTASALIVVSIRNLHGNIVKKKFPIMEIPAGAVGRHVVPFKFATSLVPDKKISVKVEVEFSDERVITDKAHVKFGTREKKTKFCFCQPEISDDDKINPGEHWHPPAAWFTSKTFPLVTLKDASSNSRVLYGFLNALTYQ